MFDLPLFLGNGALCAAAFGFAAFVYPGRKEAFALAALLACNFVFCALAYTSYAPKYALEAIGLPVTSKDLWMLADALYGSAAVLAFRRWWGYALWAIAGVQVGVHLAYQWAPFDPDLYSDRLQTLLHAQLAVFFVAGGPGAWDYMHSAFARFGRSCVGAAAAVFATRTRAE